MNLLQMIGACRCNPSVEVVGTRAELVTDSSECPVHRWVGKTWGGRPL